MAFEINADTVQIALKLSLQTATAHSRHTMHHRLFKEDSPTVIVLHCRHHWQQSLDVADAMYSHLVSRRVW